MRGVYTAVYKITALNAARTLMYLTTPAGLVAEILSASVTDENLATNFQMQVAITRITALGTPTDTGVTPVAHEAGDQASTCTVRGEVTASEPTYASTAVFQEGAAAVAGWRFAPLSEHERIYVPPSSSIGIRMITTPSSFNADVTLTYREIG
jgi:hypothetical protein